MAKTEGSHTFEELRALWEAALAAEGYELKPERGHEDDVTLDEVPDDVLDAAMRRLELGG